MQFVYSALTWGFLLALVPLAIHLINMMRHTRVRWAAMDFLLASYKKHRQWVWLKQLLLLLVRMAAVALVVAMVARLVSRSTWSAILGGRTTHHYVLLDDSYSMSDRAGATSAFDLASQAIGRITSEAGHSDFEHKLTLIRYSQTGGERGGKRKAEDPHPNPLPRGEGTGVADFNAEPIDANFAERLEEKGRAFDVTELRVGPTAALHLARELIGEASSDQNIVYLVSDYRAIDWTTPSEARAVLEELAETGAEVRLVSCARQAQANLSLEAIEPTSDTRAAGVPLFVNVRVRNHGQQAATRVQVKVRTIFYDPGKFNSSAPETPSGSEEELPVVLFDQIEAGATGTQRVQVYFPAPGQHVIEASLPEDPIAADNRRWTVVDFPEGEPVLIVDGDEKQRNAYFLSAAFAPGARANTGVRPEVQPADFLRDAVPESLAKYRVIYLMDVPRLDPRAVSNLESYVQAGGGLAFFIGPACNTTFYNASLFQDGKGLLPAPLDLADELVADAQANKPDVEAESHPIFDPLLAEQNPLIRYVLIERYVRVLPTWRPTAGASTRVIARLRNRAPLAIERSFGSGRVVSFMTTPSITNWATDPTFVVVALKTQSYLAREPASDQGRLVGAPLSVELEAAKYRPDVKFLLPGPRGGSRIVLDRAAEVTADTKTLVATTADSDRSGIYEVWPTTLEGVVSPRRFAVNVDPAEGDLALADAAELVTKLAPVKVSFGHYDDDLAASDSGASHFSLMLLGLLVMFLLAEQWLAYSASYHPLPSTVRT